jgi:hypothetical protein
MPLGKKIEAAGWVIFFVVLVVVILSSAISKSQERTLTGEHQYPHYAENVVCSCSALNISDP